MKPIQTNLGGLCILGCFVALLSLLHAHEEDTAVPVQMGTMTSEATPVQAAAVNEVDVMLQANEATTPLSGDVPGLNIRTLVAGPFLLDDRAIDYDALAVAQTQARSASSGGMWMMNMDESGGGDFASILLSIPRDSLYLQITNVANGLAYLTLNNATDLVYEIWSKTNLTLTNWNIEQELWPTNPTVMPFIVPELNRTNLFVWARDWTGIDENSNGLPDWWEWKYFGDFNQTTNGDYDNDGVNIGYEYAHDMDPNKIQFFISVTNDHVNNAFVPVQLNINGGTARYLSVVDSTNFTGGTAWNPYTSSNIVVHLDPVEGRHQIWIGLRGLPSDAYQTWQETTFTLDTTPPVIIVTNPVTSVVSQPLIQVQGLASEELSSLTFDVSNASGIFTNQAGYVTGKFYDTNLLAFTTNYFQCYDVSLANGLNVITLHATDLAGNTAASSFNVTLDYSGDTTPPMIQVVWPNDGALISGRNFVLQARVDDVTAQVTAMIVDSSDDTNTVQGSVQRDGTVWAQNLPLASGTNTVIMTATDAAGNASVTNFNVIQSAVTLNTDPISDDQLNQSSVSVSGTVSDPTEIVTVNGVTAIVETNGAWNADNVPVSAVGVADIDVETYPNGSDPSSTPSDGGQHSDEWQPPTIRIFSYELGDNYWENTHLTSFYYCNEGVNPCTDASRTNLYIQDCRQITTDNRDTYWERGQGGFDRIDSDEPTGRCSDAPTQYRIWNKLPADYPSYADIPRGESDEYRESGTYDNGDPYTLSSWLREKFELETGLDGAEVERIYLVQALMDDGYGGLPYEWFQINGQTLMASDNANSDGTGWGQTIITVPAGVTNLDVTPVGGDDLKNFQLAEETGGSYIFQDVYYRFNMAVQKVNLQLAVDHNRDGNITFDLPDQTNPDKTTSTNPYRFWVNDSKESGDDETSGGADDQIPGQGYFTANYSLIHVNGRSDLVNFFPVVLCLSNTLQQLPPSSGYEYHLVQDDSAVKFVYTSLTSENAFDYLTNTASTGYGINFDEDVTKADTIQVTYAPGAALDINWLEQINNGTGVILVEGCAATTKPLWLEIWRDGKLLAGMPLYLSITGVEQMFRHLNLSAYGNGSVDVASRYDALNEPPTENKNLVFLHGYNVNQQQARGVESEMFKRFYWSGSKAKFYGVTWNGSQTQVSSIGFTPDLQTNIVNALLTAPHLASFLGTLSGETTVAAHSLGNMVVLSAISDYNATISKYFMIDSAVPMEAIQGDMADEPAMVYSTWQQYSNRLYASKWWQLFSASDARSTLTWSNRLGNLQNVDIYNFYSSHEEVLREDTEDPPSTIIGSGAQEVINAISFWGGAGLPFGTYAWVWQEKGKGTDTSDTFIGSMHGGWAFNLSYYTYNEDGAPPTHMLASDAASLSNSELQTNAFFDFTSEYNGYGVDTADLALYGSGGSSYAQVNRDRILSDAIPALTLPVGANSVTILDQPGRPHNFNMTSGTFQNGWPLARSTGDEAYNWHHSDFDYVAYAFTYKLFNQITTLGNLK